VARPCPCAGKTFTWSPTDRMTMSDRCCPSVLIMCGPDVARDVLVLRRSLITGPRPATPEVSRCFVCPRVTAMPRCSPADRARTGHAHGSGGGRSPMRLAAQMARRSDAWSTSGPQPWAFSSRSQDLARAASAAACSTWDRPSVSACYRPPLSVAIVTHLVTRPRIRQRPLSGGQGESRVALLSGDLGITKR
jgi:hypothetical protein